MLFIANLSDMDTENPFRTTDPNSEEDDDTKKLKMIWCGIANSTNQELKISIRTYASLPDSTQGRHSMITISFKNPFIFKDSNLVLV